MTTELNRGTAVITGASSGIGAVYAERLADRGFDLVLVARSAEKLAAQASSIAARTGRKVEVLAADLSAAEGRAKVERRLGEDESITLLLNSAGIAAGGALGPANADEIDTMLSLNILTLTRFSDAAAKAFTLRKAGTIINISSGMAFILSPTSAAYAGSKAYVLNYTLGLNEALAPHGVRVQAVLPGYTRTPMLSDALLAAVPAELVMPVDLLVDGALAGLDQGELVTIPSLTDASDWQAYDAARGKLAQGASRDRPAARYGLPLAA